MLVLKNKNERKKKKRGGGEKKKIFTKNKKLYSTPNKKQ